MTFTKTGKIVTVFQKKKKEFFFLLGTSIDTSWKNCNESSLKCWVHSLWIDTFYSLSASQVILSSLTVVDCLLSENKIIKKGMCSSVSLACAFSQVKMCRKCSFLFLKYILTTLKVRNVGNEIGRKSILIASWPLFICHTFPHDCTDIWRVVLGWSGLRLLF